MRFGSLRRWEGAAGSVSDSRRAGTASRAVLAFAAAAAILGVLSSADASPPATSEPASSPPAGGDRVPDEVRQLIVAVAEDWNATSGLLWCFERMPDSSWRRTLFPQAIPVLFGREGLAWGRGRLVEGGADDRSTGIEKTEGDRRAPAGVFRIGRVYGEAPSLPEGSSVDYPYRRVTEWDAWVDDAENPYYNRHVVVDPSRVPAWFEKQRMRLGDPAYAWRLEIRHNADPPVPGKGSAIFFHIRRDENRATHGCTTMRRTDLESIIRWLRVRADPHYALLPRAEYERLRERWDLPELPED